MQACGVVLVRAGVYDLLCHDVYGAWCIDEVYWSRTTQHNNTQDIATATNILQGFQEWQAGNTARQFTAWSLHSFSVQVQGEAGEVCVTQHVHCVQQDAWLPLQV
jgi:hypothetical protein